MKKYEILKHRADLQIRFSGKTKQDLFQNALLGIAENMKPKVQKSVGKIKRRVEIKSLDINALLVDFLNEVLALGQINKEIYFKIEFFKFSDTELTGELFGRKVESFGEDIKAVTYHGLDILQKQDKTWEATVLLDI